MGYDFTAKNPEAGEFHLGAFSWPHLIEQFGHLFSCTQGSAQWYCVFGADPRMPQGATYPALISNDGFEVTAEESKIIARMTRNYVAVQKSLPEESRLDTNREYGKFEKPWPMKIRDDWVEKFAAFADWSDKSGGFQIF